MGEGLGIEMSDGKFDIKSAGIAPIGVHPAAIDCMREIGIDISEQTSDMLSRELIDWADYIITMCNNARDHCPVFPSRVKHIHWDIPNPDRLYLSETDRTAEFAAVRDLIKQRIEILFSELD